MKITLLFPPHWSPYQPYLSIPSLTAFLREKGYSVSQRDINIEWFDYFTSTAGLKNTYKKIIDRLEHIEDKKGKEFETLSQWEKAGPDIIRTARDAKQLLKQEETFFNLPTFLNSSLIISQAYQMAGASYYPTYIDFYYVGQKYSSNSTKGVMEAINDREGNLYIDYFENFTIPSLKEEPSDFYGISITDFAQMIPGLTLASVLKKNFPSAHICIGGNAFTRVGPKLTSSKLFDIFDSIIIYEGETALLKLLKAIENNDSFKEVPNIIYKNKNGELVFNKDIENPEVNALPAPDFDGLPLDKYLSPYIVLPLLSARGCYWNKCTFCQHKYNYQGGYRPRKTEIFLEDIKKLQEKYGCKFFSINDEAITPLRLKTIAEELLKNNIDVIWEAHARAEKHFNKELAEVLFNAGCRMMSFGLESSSKRVLKLMNKGIEIDILEKILSCSSKAGIWNHVWFFTGFPSETEEEATETVDFVLNNQDTVHSVPFNVTFGLEGGTDIIKHPEKYSIKEVKPPGDNDLSFVYDYTVSGGLSQERAESLAKEFQERLKKEHSQSLFIYTMTATHRMLYVNHFKTNRLDKKLLNS